MTHHDTLTPMTPKQFNALLESIKGNLISWLNIYEKGEGWRHEIAVKTEDNATIVIVDDNDDVEVLSDDPNTDVAETVKLWTFYEMGTSTFGSGLDQRLLVDPRVGITYDDVTAPVKWPSQNPRLRTIWEGSGVSFSHIE